MEKVELIERAKMYLKLLCDGVHPVSGAVIPGDSAFADEKVRRCFSFISDILDEYVELSERVELLEKENEKLQLGVSKKADFSITKEQCNSIKLSKEPITVLSFMKNINSVIDTDTTEKLTSTRINKWLADKGLVTTSKVQTVINKTVYTPSELATKIGIVEEEFVDKKSGEVKAQLKLSQSAQLFILENIDEIIKCT